MRLSVLPHRFIFQAKCYKPTLSLSKTRFRSRIYTVKSKQNKPLVASCQEAFRHLQRMDQIDSQVDPLLNLY